MANENDMRDKFYKFYTPERIELFKNIAFKKKVENQNKVFYEYYLNIVNKCVKLFGEVGVSGPFEASGLFQYMLWNGYFSKDQNLVYSMAGRHSLIGAMGADIMLGRSVCENNAEMLVDVLNAMKIEAYLLGCELNDSLNLNYQSGIICEGTDEVNFRQLMLDLFVCLTPLKHIGNHMATLFKYRENYYIGDPTNLAFFEFTDILKAQVIGGRGNIQIKPWVTLYYGNISSEDFTKVMEGTFASVGKHDISLTLLKFICEEISRKKDYVHSILKDFYSDIHSDIEGVCKNLVKRR